MAGKECVAIGSDLRFGVQLQTLATDYKKICEPAEEGSPQWRRRPGNHPRARCRSTLTAHPLPCTPHTHTDKIHDQLFIGLAGLGTDAESL